MTIKCYELILPTVQSVSRMFSGKHLCVSFKQMLMNLVKQFHACDGRRKKEKVRAKYCRIDCWMPHLHMWFRMRNVLEKIFDHSTTSSLHSSRILFLSQHQKPHRCDIKNLGKGRGETLMSELNFRLGFPEGEYALASPPT